MICYMDGKTFLKKFIKETSPDAILDTQFVVVSSKIRKTQKWRSVISATALFPSIQLLVDFEDCASKGYIEAYMNQLEENKEFLSVIIKYAIEEDENVVFLCGESEMKYRAFEMIQEYVETTFDYHICDYKKLRKGNDREILYDRDSILRTCADICDSAKHRDIDKCLTSEAGIQNLKEGMGKKPLKKFLRKELKKYGLYIEGMSLSEMIETYNIFK